MATFIRPANPYSPNDWKPTSVPGVQVRVPPSQPVQGPGLGHHSPSDYYTPNVPYVSPFKPTYSSQQPQQQQPQQQQQQQQNYSPPPPSIPNYQNYNTGDRQWINGRLMRNTGGGWEIDGQDPQAMEEAYYNEINSIYDESNNVLNQQEAQVRGNEGNLIKAYSSQFDAQKPLLDQAKNEGLAMNKGQIEKEQAQSQNALAEARRLYSELNQGVRQRFGGENSAADFANAFYGREFQRQSGNIQQTQGQNMTNLMNQQSQIQEKYSAQVQALESQKQGAIAQAKLAFQQQLDAINNTRFQLTQQKAQAKLDALRELRGRVNAIADQATQYKQQLDAAVQTANLNLRNSILSYQAQAGKPVELDQYGMPQFDRINGGVAGPNALDMATGYYSNRREEEQPMMGM